MGVTFSGWKVLKYAILALCLVLGLYIDFYVGYFMGRFKAIDESLVAQKNYLLQLYRSYIVTIEKGGADALVRRIRYEHAVWEKVRAGGFPGREEDDILYGKRNGSVPVESSGRAPTGTTNGGREVPSGKSLGH